MSLKAKPTRFNITTGKFSIRYGNRCLSFEIVEWAPYFRIYTENCVRWPMR